MSILSGYGKFKRYVLTDSGYKLCSHWTSSNTVEFDDGNTAQTKLGAISGITDSLTADSPNVALSAAGGKNLQTQISELNSNLYYTFQAADNDYFVSQGFSVIERSGVMYVESTMQLTKTLPSWTSVKIGQINNWDKGSRALGFPSSINGVNSITIILSIEQNGDVYVRTHGTVDVENSGWFYGLNCFVI